MHSFEWQTNPTSHFINKAYVWSPSPSHWQWKWLNGGIRTFDARFSQINCTNLCEIDFLSVLYVRATQSRETISSHHRHRCCDDKILHRRINSNTIKMSLNKLWNDINRSHSSHKVEWNEENVRTYNIRVLCRLVTSGLLHFWVWVWSVCDTKIITSFYFCFSAIHSVHIRSLTTLLFTPSHKRMRTREWEQHVER